MKVPVILLFVISLAVSVVAQGKSSSSSSQPSPTSTPSSTDYDKCVEEKQCAVGDTACFAACAKVPSPSDDQASRTNQCTEGCNKNDPKAYSACVQRCIKNIFLATPTSTSSSSATETGTDGNNNNNNKNGTAKRSPGIPNSASTFATFSLAIVGVALFAGTMVL